MSNPVFIRVFCEGQTEQNFIKKLIAPYLLPKNIFVNPVMIHKPGQKGGDVKFSRVELDIKTALLQPNVAAVSTFVDYYGLQEWPGKNDVPRNSSPEQVADCLNNAAKEIICRKYDSLNPQHRFIPFVAVHEFEALLFSDSSILANSLRIEQSEVDEVLSRCGCPEKINNSPLTAPSKRIRQWNPQYGKTTSGIAIAATIGIDKMREKCPLFHAWLRELERIAEM